MNGILLVDKPHGWTSFDVVGKVRSIATKSALNVTGRKRFPVGHTGTLDPLATGLLVVLLGKYTKRASDLTKLGKTYEVTMRLGLTSTTGDEEGQKTPFPGHGSEREVAQKEVTQALQKFSGTILQTPPIYSAIKVNGQRAYKLARQGSEVRLEPREVTIYDIRLTGYTYPVVRFTAEVSSGTYIRSLVEDIGQELGTGAYMCDLRRTKVGAFDLVTAVPADQLSTELIVTHVFQLD